ncbi:SAV_915 family protein [Demequina oxidasica]|uniref:SAV_915 family protein n=1 Tax=Demequina oxidasica TaxID=676199 RepID=UPI0034E1E1C7
MPVRTHPGSETVPEVRPLVDGRKALLAYTALDRLANACGDNQAWVLLHLADLEPIKADFPFDVVAFDPQLPADLFTNGRLT